MYMYIYMYIYIYIYWEAARCDRGSMEASARVCFAESRSWIRRRRKTLFPRVFQRGAQTPLSDYFAMDPTLRSRLILDTVCNHTASPSNILAPLVAANKELTAPSVSSSFCAEHVYLHECMERNQNARWILALTRASAVRCFTLALKT